MLRVLLTARVGVEADGAPVDDSGLDDRHCMTSALLRGGRPALAARDTARANLGDDAFAQMWEEGRALPLPEGVRTVLEG